MDQPNEAVKPTFTGESTLDTLAKNRSVIPLGFALVIIFYFFSFCNFKCNSMKVASLTGINMVTGTHIKTGADQMFGDNPFDAPSGYGQKANKTSGDKVEPNIWAILGLLSAIGGGLAFYKRLKNEAMIGTVAGAVGVISLLLLRSAIKRKIESQGGGMAQIEIDFVFGYWACLLSFLVAGGISYLRNRKGDKTPPGLKTDPPKPAITPLHVNIVTQQGPASN